MRSTSPRQGRRLLATVGAIACLAASLAACGSSSSGATNTKKDDPNATLTVWTDATRQVAFQDYQKANPSAKLKIVVVDQLSILSKIRLANRVGSGWPDVVFEAPQDIAALSSAPVNYALALNNYVPKDVQDNFAGHNSVCTFGGKVYCLGNDLAQTVLWYNKPLMAQFGYQVPTTWQEYQALGEKVAAEHPGYIIGAEGGDNIYYDELTSSGCPTSVLSGPDQVTINTKADSCTRVASILDPLLADGSVSRLSPTDPGIVSLAKENKILMFPGPSWWAQFVMGSKTGWDMPNGLIAAAPYPTWPGASTNYSGAWGGGIYVVSAHSANKAGAVAIAQWVATNPAYQTTAPTYPAYIPAAKQWEAAVKASPLYAEDPSQVLTDAAPKINAANASVKYEVYPSIEATVEAAIKGGKTIASAFPDLQSQLVDLAQAAGYDVKTS